MKKIIILLFIIIFSFFLTGCIIYETEITVSKTITKTTTAPAESAAAEEARLGSRTNPVPLGSTYYYDGSGAQIDKYKADITVTEVLRGEEAWALVRQGSESNPPAPEGKEYLIIKVKIKAIESENDEKIDIGASSFDLVGKDGAKYDGLTAVSGVEPQLKEMRAGEEQEGYIVFAVNVGDEPLAVFLDRNDGGVWLSLK
ncbi:MAG TPA: DUF4352 domain-containing protein [Bacillota bacterium]|nr:DUF4352 domain-containing protein [Bacillota bacterium]HOK68761.1 DUF4352 domain-containing protein [Bacillota bacterium]HPP85756.1 DUF4352 domain-containing protein [Bacillota bacterium]